jgi:hypothetical protein
MARLLELIDIVTGFCFYCTHANGDPDPLGQRKVCFRCMTTRLRSDFPGVQGEEQKICQQCLMNV